MNKYKVLSSSIVLPCMLMSTALLAAEQGTEQYSGLHKQLSIMSDIIKSSVTDKSANQLSKINSIESTYLRGQGVVFTISSAANNSQWGNYSFNFSMPEMPTLPEMPAAPIAPEVNQNFHEKFDIDINQTVSHAMESAAVGYERIVEIFEHNRDKTRELREEQRELAYNLRDVEREKRDLNYQLARASDERKAEIIKDLKSLEKQESKLNEDKVKITDKANDLAKKQKAEQSKRIEHRAQYYQQLTVKLTETLCLYGNGLKELPKQEHVSVILKSAGEQSSGRYKDSILVFTKEDIASCSADKISAAKLMEKSQAYQF
ncbi:hypothetical protein [Colwellia sp. Arc7-D]|jgi:hypothetical protein|uniref:hypothetical protein n=1 Tax=Colwellia sp. Arc7-D TaxID=2161872 RepID=UPI000D34BA27|nr:hypothetical protein [Colwellia sp. Arc7-D]AWB58819.1 hypothetical protein DBO93_15465 [Colwellia sp. Arc7-D]|tara:strand:- start:973 stop:1926 length:954 start_codon:yes stop_codon:yes gene_type:complete